MYCRKYINFCMKWTNLFYLTAIRTFVVFQNHLADCNFLKFVNSFINKGNPVLMLLCITLFQTVFDTTDIFFTNLFYISKYSFFHSFRCNEINHVIPHIFRNIEMLILVFLFTTLSNNLVKELDNLSIQLMGTINCLNHRSFINFVCTGFNHDNFISCRSNGKC